MYQTQFPHTQKHEIDKRKQERMKKKVKNILLGKERKSPKLKLSQIFHLKKNRNK